MSLRSASSRAPMTVMLWSVPGARPDIEPASKYVEFGKRITKRGS